ncbi:TfoX/Sxy family protein [Rhodobacteraceae bacterium]|nr:TfoX/Sxy family protein [Paracoccaceae bacterium]
MTDAVSAIRNLGPASDAAFARAGITTADQLRALGADPAYTQLLAAGSKPHFIGYYSLVMGLMGRPWNDCRGAEKADLRKRFDAICAASPKRENNPIEAILDEIGVVARREETP